MVTEESFESELDFLHLIVDSSTKPAYLLEFES